MKYAKARAAYESGESSSAYLMLRLRRWEFALPASAVCSLIRAPSILPLPGSPAWLAGLLNAGNLCVPVIDLGIRLGMKSGAAAGEAIVVTGPTAFLVDRILDTVNIPSREIQAIRGANSLPFKNFVSGAWRGRSRTCYLVQVETIRPPDPGPYLRAVLSSLCQDHAPAVLP